IIDVARTITTDAQNRVPHLAFQPDQIVELPILPITEIQTAYYLRMRVDDRPGVMAEITRIMGDNDISIEAILQKEPESGATQATIIMLTQRIREQQMDDAIVAIAELEVVHGDVHRIRVETLDGD
ncbi:MAG: ACT domain-containing protein, partial [Gammaproteobacteria bacterium]|nr:ACT domain-containing protein [Gammaproteobacteria bacterium]